MKITIELEKDRNVDVNVKLGKDSERRGFTPVREYIHNGTPLKESKRETEFGNAIARGVEEGFKNKVHNGTVEVKKAEATAPHSDEQEHPARKTLCIVKCPKCGKISFIPLPVQDGKVNLSKPMTCLNCGEELDLGDLHPGEAKCPNCGNAIWFYGAGREDLEITCKNCGSPIDLIYNDKEKEFRSANLFGPGVNRP